METPEAAPQITNITVPVYNRPELVARTLPGVKRHTDAPHLLCVVDNGSGPETRDLLLRLAADGIIDRLFLLDANYGVSCAVNVGWRLLRAARYMKLDSDMLVTRPGWLSQILALWTHGDARSLLGPLWPDQIGVRSGACRATPDGELFDAILTLPGCAVLVPDAAVREIGYWSEDYGVYGEEDADYSIRAHYAGYALYGYRASRFLEDLQPASAGGMPQAVKDKVRERNVGSHEEYGLYTANEYLFASGARDLRVPLKYEIEEMEGHAVRIGLSRRYVAFRKKLQRVRGEINARIRAGARLALAHPETIAAFREMLRED